ncbi:MAG: Ig-like domain-containing protein, partial [Anaerolineae bacterium]|nr:Ig-like domain-containing protein [Anaerolineae bacterium]
TPTEGFEAATEYTARISAGLTDALGNASLADDFEWTFTTVTPQVVASLPAEGDIYVSPSPVISVTFNQAMDRASVEENLSLVNDATGDTVSGAFNWADHGLRPPAPDEFEGYYDYAYEDGDGPEEVGVETVAFTPDTALDFGVVYHIELPQGTKGAIGGAVTPRDFSATFTVSPLPEIASTYPADGDEGVEPWQGLQVTFNAPIDPASVVIGENVIIEPTVSVTQVYTYWWSSNTNLEIDFPGEASSRYTVSLGPGIEGRYGQPLAEGAEVSWETRAQSPLVFLHSPGRIATYNAYTDTVAYVSVRNVSQVSFKLFRLPLADFVRLNGNNWWSDWDNYQGSADADDLLAEWSLSSNGDLDSTLIYEVDIGRQSGLGEAMPPGMYYLEASADLEDIYPPAQGAQDLSSLSARQMLVVSRNNLTFKSTSSEALAWLTDLESGQPVADVPVTFLTGDTVAGELGQAATDAEGVAEVKFDPLKEFYTTRFAITGDPADPDANFAVTASTWADGIERYQFDNVSSEDYQQPYNANLYTDRNIYRPGQTVYFKGIIRADDDAHYSLPGSVEVATLLVTDSQGKEIFNDELPLSRMGTVNGSFDLDANAGLGFYSMQIQLAPDINFYHDFQVAAYRKPEFLVTAETDKAEYSQGEMVQVTAAAEYFFGGPVSNADVRWTLLSSDYSFPYQGDGFYDFTDYDTSRSAVYYSSFGETLAEGEGTTDADGRITFEVEADIADKISSQRFTFDIVVTDLNNQEVASQAAAVVHKGLFYVGLQPQEYVNSANRESAVNVLVVDWESRPVARQEVQIVFAEHNWYSVQRQYEDGGFYWDSEVETIPVYTTTVTTDRAGEAVARFTPTKGGIYRVMSQATDRAGNEVRSSTFMWVSGSQYVNWRQENNDRIDLVADQREYNVGDTATILVPHP